MFAGRYLNVTLNLQAAVLAAVFAVCTAPPAAADLNFKKKIIENCAEAEKDFEALDPESRRNFIPDLRLILKLNFNRVESLGTDNTLPGHTFPLPDSPEELKGVDVMKMFQPNREIQAKKCAVQILSRLSPYSVEAVPEMITLSDDRTLPFDFSDLINRTVQDITVAAANDRSFQVPQSALEDLTGLLLTPSSYKAGNALLELQAYSIPHLLKDLEKPDQERRDRITDALLQIDDSGRLTGQGIIALLNSADDELRKRAAALLAELEYTYPFTVPELIRKLNDISPDVEQAALNTLSRIFKHDKEAGKIVLEADAFDQLMQAFEHSRPAMRETLAEGLKKMGPLFPGFESRLLKTLEIEDQFIRASAIEVLGSIRSPSPDTMKALMKALDSPSLKVRLKAIEALGRQKPSKSLIAALVKLMKSNAAEKNPEVKQVISNEIAKSVIKLSPASLGAPLVPLFIQVVQTGSSFLERNISLIYPIDINNMDGQPGQNSHLAVSALIAIGKDSVAPSIKAMSSKDPFVKQRLAFVVAGIKPVGAQGIKALAQLLNDQNRITRNLAEQLLVETGKEAIPEVQKYYKSSNKETRYTAARILSALGKTDKKMSEVILEKYSRESCPDKAILARSLTNLKSPERDAAASQLIECIKKDQFNPDQINRAILELAPLSPENRDTLLRDIQEGALQKKAQIHLLEKSVKIGFSDDQAVSLISDALKNSDKPVQLRLISMLRNYGDSAKPAVPLLLDFINQNSNDELLAHEALIVLTRIDPAAFDYPGFLVEQLGRNSYQWAQKTITRLEPELAINVLEKALKELSTDKRIRAIQAAGSLGDKAAGLTQYIVDNLNAVNPGLRYASTISLLKIDPQHPAALPALKREIISDEGRNLSAETLPPPAGPVLEQLMNESKSLTEKKIAEELLNKIPA